MKHNPVVWVYSPQNFTPRDNTLQFTSVSQPWGIFWKTIFWSRQIGTKRKGIAPWGQGDPARKCTWKSPYITCVVNLQAGKPKNDGTNTTFIVNVKTSQASISYKHITLLINIICWYICRLFSSNPFLKQKQHLAETQDPPNLIVFGSSIPPTRQLPLVRVWVALLQRNWQRKQIACSLSL